MEPLEVIEQIRPCLVARPVSAMVNAFPLEHSEEAFAGRVVGAVTDRAHAADQGALALVGEVLVHAWRPDHAQAVFVWISRMRLTRRALARARGPGVRHAQA